MMAPGRFHPFTVMNCRRASIGLCRITAAATGQNWRFRVRFGAVCVQIRPSITGRIPWNLSEKAAGTRRDPRFFFLHRLGLVGLLGRKRRPGEMFRIGRSHQNVLKAPQDPDMIDTVFQRENVHNAIQHQEFRWCAGAPQIDAVDCNFARLFIIPAYHDRSPRKNALTVLASLLDYGRT
jgi:hypothetical protein